MGTDKQENRPRNPNQQQQGGGKQTTSPRSPGETGKGNQDAGTIGSPSRRSDREGSEKRGKDKS